MPKCKPFRLEPPDRPVASSKNARILYTKGSYVPDVKITGWDEHQQSLPYDNAPYCPGSLNYHLSHHKRFGFGIDEPLKTTTQCMLEQISLKDEVDKLNSKPKKYMVNYLTFKDTLACTTNIQDKICPDLCAGSYTTTMQTSYCPPYPYVMGKLSVPKTPFLQNRICQFEEGEESDYKFFDDPYKQRLNHIQKVKLFKWISYNPCTSTNNYGPPPHERKLKCFNLDY